MGRYNATASDCLSKTRGALYIVRRSATTHYSLRTVFLATSYWPLFLIPSHFKQNANH